MKQILGILVLGMLAVPAYSQTRQADAGWTCTGGAKAMVNRGGSATEAEKIKKECLKTGIMKFPSGVTVTGLEKK